MATELYHDGTLVDCGADGTLCELGTLRRRFASPFTLDLFQALRFDEPPPWHNNDSIRLDVDGTTRFQGKITAHERAASATAEGIRYQCVGLRDQARDVTFRKTLAGAVTSRIVYNCPPDEAEEEALHLAAPGTDTTVGEIVADILDSMAAELSGIVGDGSPGSGYAQAQLDALSAMPGKVVLDGLGVDEAIDAVMRHAPNFAWFIDPATTKAVFVDLSALTAKDLAGVNGAVIRHSLNTTTAGCYTACTVEGARERVDLLDQGLTPDWDPAYEADWSLAKACQFPDTYGRTFRKWRCEAAIAAGGTVVSRRAVGTGEIVCLFTVTYGNAQKAWFCLATAADDGTSLWTRGWPIQPTTDGSYEACEDGSAWYTYARGRISGRHPASGYAGTAYTLRGLERERFLTQEDRGKVLVDGTVGELTWVGKTEGDEAFRSHYTKWLTDEFDGCPIAFERTGETRTIVSNTLGKLILDQAPDPALEVGDAFTIAVVDATAPDYGGLSILEVYAREFVAWHGDEKFQGTVPLDGLDWSIALGQKVNFTGTNDPALATLGATLLEVAHDLAGETTTLALTSERSLGGAASWAELAAQRERARRLQENETQIRRIWQRLQRERRPVEAHTTEPAEEESDLEGDETWITITDSGVVRHTGPDTGSETGIGVPGSQTHVVSYVGYDARGHLVEGSKLELLGDGIWIRANTQYSPGTLQYVHTGPGPQASSVGGGVVKNVNLDGRGHVVGADTTGKTAILKLGDEWRGLYCCEMPECRFLDIVRIVAIGPEARKAVAPLFIEACEPGDVRVLSANPESVLPGRAAFRVDDGVVVGAFDPPLTRPVAFMVTISGRRRGVRRRFPVYPEGVARHNNEWWAKAYQPD